MYFEAWVRREAKVFSATGQGVSLVYSSLRSIEWWRWALHGQPQCLRKATTVGFPFFAGNGRRWDEGAFAPISGAGEVVSAVGVIQELSSC